MNNSLRSLFAISVYGATAAFGSVAAHAESADSPILYQCIGKNTKAPDPNTWQALKYFPDVTLRDRSAVYNVILTPDCDKRFANGSFYIMSAKKGAAIEIVSRDQGTGSTYTGAPQYLDLSTIGEQNIPPSNQYTQIQTFDMKASGDDTIFTLARRPDPAHPYDLHEIKTSSSYGTPYYTVAMCLQDCRP